MSIESRLAKLENRSGDDGPPRVAIVRLPEKLSPDEWARVARAHANGEAVSFPVRTITYTNGRKTA